MAKQTIATALTVPVKLPTCDGNLGPEAARFNGRVKCSNFARYQIEGRNLCQRHAQQAALEILLRAVQPSGEKK